MRNKITIALLFAFAFASRMTFWRFKGTTFAPDSSRYIDTCSHWFQSPYQALSGQVGIEYAGFTLPFCTFLQIPGTTIDAWIAIQIIMSSIAVVLVFDAGRVMVDYRAGLVGGIGMAMLFQNFHWSVYVLSDSLFVTAVTVGVWSLAKYQNDQSFSNTITMRISLIYMALTRPFGVPMVGGWLIFDLLPAQHEERRVSILPRWMALAVILVLVSAVAIISVRGRWVGSHVIETWKQGVIILNDPWAYKYQYQVIEQSSLPLFVLSNIEDIIIMGVIKIIALFVPFVPRFSIVHILINSFTYVPLLALALVGIMRAVRKKDDVAFLLLPPLAGVLLIVAITFVDYDWRYRAPIGPILALFAGFATSTSPIVRGAINRIETRLAEFLGFGSAGAFEPNLKELERLFDRHSFEELEETAVPGYRHGSTLIRHVFATRFNAVLAHSGDVSDKSIADIGCGAGLMLEALNTERAELITGIDIDASLAREYLEDSASPNSGINLIQADASQIPIRSNSTDIVIAMDVLEHLGEIELAAREINRILTPDGKLVITGPTESALYKIGRIIAGFRSGYHERDIQDVNSILLEEGFEKCEESSISPILTVFKLYVYER